MTLRSTAGARAVSADFPVDASSSNTRQVNERMLDLASTTALALGHHHFFRRVHEVALDELHAQLPQHGHGVGVLDAFGDGFYLELDGLLDQLLDDDLRLG